MAKAEVRTAADSRQIACVGCGALVPDSRGPTHRYIGASPGCWALFGEVVAREFGDARYGAVHQMTVDAYAVQHPGTPSPQSIKSVGVHLIGLFLALEKGYDSRQATLALHDVATRARAFHWLAPPPAPEWRTIVYVVGAKDPSEHKQRVSQWAESVWNNWIQHHATVRQWADLNR